MRLILCLFALSLTLATPSAANTGVVDSHEATLRSVGTPEMDALMDALFDGFAHVNPRARKGVPWSHRSDSLAIGALMFEQADIAPMIRDFDRNELAPYDHQFRGDMMKAPVMIPVALRDAKPVWIAVNRRPGAPLSDPVREFLEFVLSLKGQDIVDAVSGFRRLTSDDANTERAKLAGFVAPLDHALPEYSGPGNLTGEISSVGSDGMKSLMEHWMDGFSRHHPKVRRGKHWEHLGTLNGFHALVHGLADIAPMGRELWPQEAAAYSGATGKEPLLEIRVARGGFNTPQRTTAQAIFVHVDNPVGEITLPQLTDIFGPSPTVTKWGQLGASGIWADRPISIYTPPLTSPNAMSLQISLLKGAAWNPAVRSGSIAETAAAAAGDPAAIAFGGFEEGGPGLKTLAVAASNQSPAIAATYETASTGSYPLTRYMYIRLANPKGSKLPLQVAHFLRFILSREGQAAIPSSGYFPLSAREAKSELAKLDGI